MKRKFSALLLMLAVLVGVGGIGIGTAAAAPSITQDGHWYTSTQFPGGIGAQVQYEVTHSGGLKGRVSGYSAYVTDGSCFQAGVLQELNTSNVVVQQLNLSWSGCKHSVSLANSTSFAWMNDNPVGGLHAVLSMQTTSTGGAATWVIAG